MLPVGQTRLIAGKRARLLVSQKYVSMQTYYIHTIEKLRKSNKQLIVRFKIPVPSGGPDPTYWERTYISE
jgi:hypothetical protein